MTDTPNAIDIHVGARIVAARERLGLLQEDLAQRTGIPLDIVDAHERGYRRVPAEQLCAIAATLDTTISYFFGDFPA